MWKKSACNVRAARTASSNRPHPHMRADLQRNLHNFHLLSGQACSEDKQNAAAGSRSVLFVCVCCALLCARRLDMGMCSHKSLEFNLLKLSRNCHAFVEQTPTKKHFNNFRNNFLIENTRELLARETMAEWKNAPRKCER